MKGGMLMMSNGSNHDMKAIQMTTAAVAAVIAVVSFGGVLTVSPDGMSPREALLAIRATKVGGCARALKPLGLSLIIR